MPQAPVRQAPGLGCPLVTQTVSIVLVSFSAPAATLQAARSVLAGSFIPLEVLIADNHPEAPTANALPSWELGPAVRVIHSGTNLGYTAACNRAAREAAGDWLLFLNPDAHVDPDCVSVLLAAAEERTGVIGAQVLLPDGRTNAGHNPLHITGLSWAGRYGEARERGPARQVAAVSGAALMARRSAYEGLGGMCERFFMYQDDVDLCWRMSLAGWSVLYCPDAVVWHEYEFQKGKEKWYWLERNRVWSVLSNYSPATIVLLSPLLAGTEIVVAARAAREGWGTAFARAWWDNLRSAGELRRWRAAVQRTRCVRDSELISRMTARVQTPLLHSWLAARLGGLMEVYRRAVLRVLRAAHR
ncbi:MAG: hypothetical protein QOK36_3798 [Gaiellales bacterium]|nr:hypothetical protein [Gaiellales bacterium]